MITRPKLARERAFVAAPPEGLEQRQPVQLVSRIWFQLLGGLLFAVLVPALARWPVSNVLPSESLSSLQYAMLGSMVALVTGYWALRQMIVYPGVQATQYIVPTFAVSYAIIIVAFFFLRIDYSRYQFAASFAVAVTWFYACFLLSRRGLRQRFGLVQAGNTRGLQNIASVDWLAMRSPVWPQQRIDGIVADLRAELSDDWQRFIAECTLRGIPVYHVKQMAEALTGKVEIDHLSENSLGSILPSLLYLKVKRSIDVSLAVLVFPVFAVIIWLAALAIKLDSKGPVYFYQQRRGFRGQTFWVVKLRTMHVNAERTGSQFTVDNDPRITRVGRVLRKYRIDELPQIINILAGEMSWIGPRPEAVELSQWYEREVPFYVYRHIVRPGITGWAQVNQGNVAEVEAATYKLHYDFYYIKHFSPWLDVLITAKTIRTVLTGFGSK